MVWPAAKGSFKNKIVLAPLVLAISGFYLCSDKINVITVWANVNRRLGKAILWFAYLFNENIIRGVEKPAAMFIVSSNIVLGVIPPVHHLLDGETP